MILLHPLAKVANDWVLIAAILSESQET